MADGSLDYSRDPNTRVAWLKEIAGYVPEETARKLRAEPYRFQLFGDGRVLYRDDQFKQYQVRLSPTEMNALVAELVDTGFLDIDELMPKDQEQGVLIADAGAWVTGLAVGERSKEFQASALKHLVRTFPDNDNLKACLKVCERMRTFRHSDAELVE